MNRDLLTFEPRPGVERLIERIERRAQYEILLRETDLPGRNELWPGASGFDGFMPVVLINRTLRAEFDEHALAHELLHLERFLHGAYWLEARDHVEGGVQRDIDNFATDVTTQIEHVAIFPTLESLGFDPHGAAADSWKEKVMQAPSGSSKTMAEGTLSWALISIAAMEHLGRDPALRDRYRFWASCGDPSLVEAGTRIARLISDFGVARPFNLKRLYPAVLKAAGVPRGEMHLKELDHVWKRYLFTEI